MSDIVERLRYPEGAHLNPIARDVMLKAAEEIERLRANYDAAEADRARFAAMMTELRAEIERLHNALDQRMTAYIASQEQDKAVLEELRAIIEKYIEVMATQRLRIKELEGQLAQMHKGMEDLRRHYGPLSSSLITPRVPHDEI